MLSQFVICTIIIAGVSLVAAFLTMYAKIMPRTLYGLRPVPTLTPFQKADQAREWKKALNDPAHRTTKWMFYGSIAVGTVSLAASLVMAMVAWVFWVAS